jgi:transcriptional regulator with XRE-family HTH domain
MWLPEIRALAELRLRRGWTYEQLAAAVGLTRATVYRILTTPNPRVHETTAYKIARFLEREAHASETDDAA